MQVVPGLGQSKWFLARRSFTDSIRANSLRRILHWTEARSAFWPGSGVSCTPHRSAGVLQGLMSSVHGYLGSAQTAPPIFRLNDRTGAPARGPRNSLACDPAGTCLLATSHAFY